MQFSKFIMALVAATCMQAQMIEAQDLFQLRFRGTCRLLNSIGRLDTTRITEQDLIASSVGAGALLTNDFVLVYNATSNNVQVVKASDGSFVSDVFQFQGGITNTDGRRLERLTFIFAPNQSEAIGSAIITQRIRQNAQRATIQGSVQYAFGGTDESGTNFVGGTNGLVSSPTNTINIVTNILGSTNILGLTNIFGGTNTLGNNTLNSTNAIVGTNTLGQVLGNPTLGINPNLETNTLTGALGGPNPATLGGNSSSTPPSLVDIGGSIVISNVPSGSAATSATTTPGVTTTPGTTTTTGAATTTSGTNVLAGTSANKNIQICSGTFSGGQRVLVLTNSP